MKFFRNVEIYLLLRMMSLSKSCEESDLPVSEDLPVITCKQCGKILLDPKNGKYFLDPEDSFRFREKRVLENKVILTHWYSCRPCTFNQIIPKCENKGDCKVALSENPEYRIKKLTYDSVRGETWCKKCGLVQEQVSLVSMDGVNNKRFPRPKEPKNYIPLVQKLADDTRVNWFNYTEKSLIITCTSEQEHPLSKDYPMAIIIIIT